MASRVLVTNAFGSIGAALIPQILDLTNLHVVGVSPWRGKRGPLREEREARSELLRFLDSERLEVHAEDLSDRSLWDAFERIDGDFDFFVHVPDECEGRYRFRDARYFERVLSVARERQVKAFLYANSGSAFGTTDPYASTYWSHNPSTPDATVAAVRDMLALEHARSRQIPIGVFYYLSLFGEWRTPREDPLPIAVQRMLAGQPVGVGCVRDQPIIRSRTDTYRLSVIMADALRQLDAGSKKLAAGEVVRWYITSTPPISEEEFFAAAAEALELKVEFERYEAPVGTDRIQTLPAHGRSLAPPDWKDAVGSVARWHRDHPDWPDGT